MPDIEKKSVSVVLSDADHAELVRIADEEDRPIVWQARRFIRQGLERAKKGPAPSAPEAEEVDLLAIPDALKRCR